MQAKKVWKGKTGKRFGRKGKRRIRRCMGKVLEGEVLRRKAGKI
jgi:hypothetical protein